MPKSATKIEISWHTLWKLFVFALVVVAIYLARNVIGVLFVSIVVSLALDPLVSFLEEKKIKRLLGTAIVFFAGAAFLALIVYFFVPILTIEASSFLKHIHEITYALFGIGLPNNLVDTLILGREKIFDFLASSNVSVTEALTSLFSTAVFVIATILISFYLCVEKDGTDRFLKVLLPDVYEKPIMKVFNRFKVKIRKWFSAQFLLSLIVGVVVAVGLWALGVRYSILLGLIAMIFEVVPVIGPLIVGVIAFLVAVSDSFALGVYTLIFFVIVQQFENHILTPAIIGKTMKVHPVVVIFALLAGGKIAGFIGIILAVPLAVMAQEVFNYLAEEKGSRQKFETPPPIG